MQIENKIQNYSIYKYKIFNLAFSQFAQNFAGVNDMVMEIVMEDKPKQVTSMLRSSPEVVYAKASTMYDIIGQERENYFLHYIHDAIRQSEITLTLVGQVQNNHVNHSFNNFDNYCCLIWQFRNMNMEMITKISHDSYFFNNQVAVASVNKTAEMSRYISLLRARRGFYGFERESRLLDMQEREVRQHIEAGLSMRRIRLQGANPPVMIEDSERREREPSQEELINISVENVEHRQRQQQERDANLLRAHEEEEKEFQEHLIRIAEEFKSESESVSVNSQEVIVDESSESGVSMNSELHWLQNTTIEAMDELREYGTNGDPELIRRRANIIETLENALAARRENND